MAENDKVLLRRYHEHGDLQAREQLIEQYMSLVRSLARRCSSRSWWSSSPCSSGGRRRFRSWRRQQGWRRSRCSRRSSRAVRTRPCRCRPAARSEEHTSELQSRRDLVCRLLLEKKKKKILRFFSVKKKTKK